MDFGLWTFVRPCLPPQASEDDEPLSQESVICYHLGSGCGGLDGGTLLESIKSGDRRLLELVTNRDEFPETPWPVIPELGFAMFPTGKCRGQASRAFPPVESGRASSVPAPPSVCNSLPCFVSFFLVWRDHLTLAKVSGDCGDMANKEGVALYYSLSCMHLHGFWIIAGIIAERTCLPHGKGYSTSYWESGLCSGPSRKASQYTAVPDYS